MADKMSPEHPNTNPSGFDAVLLQFRHFRDCGNWLAAESILRRFLLAHPDHTPALAHLAHVLWRMGRNSEAIAELSTGLRNNPARSPFWKTLVNWHSQLGQIDEALIVAQEWLEAMPGHIPAHLDLGRLLLAHQRFSEALEHLERVNCDSEYKLDSRLEIVCCNLRRKAVDEALQELRECLSNSYPLAIRHVAQLASLAQQLYAIKHYQAVIDCQEAVKRRGFNDPILYALHTASLQNTGRVSESTHVSREFLESLQSGDAGQRNSLRIASALWIVENYDEALAVLEDELREQPDSDRHWRTLLTWLEALGRNHEALEAAQRWVEVKPSSALAVWGLARELSRVNRHDESRHFAEDMCSHACVDRGQGMALVHAWLAARQIDSAADLMRRLLEPGNLAPRFANQVIALARQFFAHRKYEVAETCCRAVLSLRYHNREFLCLYGNVMLSGGKIKAARQVLERAVFLSAGSGDAPHLLLALSYLHEGHTDLGRAHLDEAVGAQEEGITLNSIFGAAAPFIQYFGDEIDRVLLSDRPT